MHKLVMVNYCDRNVNTVRWSEPDATMSVPTGTFGETASSSQNKVQLLAINHLLHIDVYIGSSIVSSFTERPNTWMF